MMTVIADVLDAKEVAEAREVAAQLAFTDGRATAGWAAKLVKNNLQASGGDLAFQSLRDKISAKVSDNPLFRMVARPKVLSPLIVSRYEPGMAYGSHVDDAIMGGMRTDVSFTLFLSDPDSYDGGALVIETARGEEDVKLAAGSMVVYSSTTLHRVAEVTRGARLAAVGWARSFIRDPARREMLFDLDTARQSLFTKQGKTPEFDLLAKTSANLIRMWAED